MKGTYRAVMIGIKLRDALGDEPQRKSELKEAVGIEASDYVYKRALNALNDLGMAQKVNSDGEPDEYGRLWVSS